MQIAFKNAQGMRVNTNDKTVMEFDDSSKLSIETGSFSELAKVTEIDPVEALQWIMQFDKEEIDRIVNEASKDAPVSKMNLLRGLRDSASTMARRITQEREHDEFMYQTEVLGRQGLSIPLKDFAGDFQ
ncbi:hypothetical protein ABN080_11115 [Proteus sp. fly-1089]|uniref:hypothetical protein n=1 Tax=Proteus sp. fly-1089 TaxID=3136675 RepID=UPI0032DA942F